MKMKMEAVEQSRNKIDEELSELKMGQKFIIGERDKLKEDYEELKKKMEEISDKFPPFFITFLAALLPCCQCFLCTVEPLL